jgi:hypothetical protein
MSQAEWYNLPEEEPESETKYVYRLRNKKTGKFHGGGHGTINGCYSTKRGLRSARKTMSRGWRNNEDGDSLEIVTFKLVEVGREDL